MKLLKRCWAKLLIYFANRRPSWWHLSPKHNAWEVEFTKDNEAALKKWALFMILKWVCRQSMKHSSFIKKSLRNRSMIMFAKQGAIVSLNQSCSAVTATRASLQHNQMCSNIQCSKKIASIDMSNHGARNQRSMLYWYCMVNCSMLVLSIALPGQWFFAIFLQP